MNEKDYDKQTGAERLRTLCRRFGDCRESFNSRFTAEQLLALDRAWCLSDWDYNPDRWDERQVQEALLGRTPTWGTDGEPSYDAATIPTPPPSEGPVYAIEQATRRLDDAVMDVAVQAREFLADPAFRGDLRRAVDEWNAASGAVVALSRAGAGSAGVAEGGR